MRLSPYLQPRCRGAAIISNRHITPAVALVDPVEHRGKHRSGADHHCDDEEGGQTGGHEHRPVLCVPVREIVLVGGDLGQRRQKERGKPIRVTLKNKMETEKELYSCFQIEYFYSTLFSMLNFFLTRQFGPV